MSQIMSPIFQSAMFVESLYNYLQSIAALPLITINGHASRSTHVVSVFGWSSHPCSSHGSPFRWTIAKYVWSVPSVKETVQNRKILKPTSLAVNPSPKASGCPPPGASMRCVSTYKNLVSLAFSRLFTDMEVIISAPLIAADGQISTLHIFENAGNLWN